MSYRGRSIFTCGRAREVAGRKETFLGSTSSPGSQVPRIGVATLVRRLHLIEAEARDPCQLDRRFEDGTLVAARQILGLIARAQHAVSIVSDTSLAKVYCRSSTWKPAKWGDRSPTLQIGADLLKAAIRPKPHNGQLFLREVWQHGPPCRSVPALTVATFGHNFRAR
jgi:hypothetical protein